MVLTVTINDAQFNQQWGDLHTVDSRQVEFVEGRGYRVEWRGCGAPWEFDLFPPAACEQHGPSTSTSTGKREKTTVESC